MGGKEVLPGWWRVMKLTIVERRGGGVGKCDKNIKKISQEAESIMLRDRDDM